MRAAVGIRIANSDSSAKPKVPRLSRSCRERNGTNDGCCVAPVGALDVPISAAVAPAEPDGVPGLSIRPADDNQPAKPLARHPDWFAACHTTP
jgi:hypothetical protein